VNELTLIISHEWNRYGGQWFARIEGQKKWHRFPGPVLEKLLESRPDKDNVYKMQFEWCSSVGHFTVTEHMSP